METWDPIWRQINQEFEDELVLLPHLASLSMKMFYVWEGNHRLIAWKCAIRDMFPDNKEKHYRVLCTIIDPKRVSEIALLTSLQRMNV